jgi:hypothetical protein
LIDSPTSDGFLEERETLVRRLDAQAQSAAKELQVALPDWRRPAHPVIGLGKRFIALAEAAHDTFEQSTLLNINKLLVVESALKLPETLAKRDLPEEVLAMYPAWAKRLLVYLRQVSDRQYYYPHDSFVKDLRIASGLSVPCGVQDVDLRSIIGYRASARCLLRYPSARYFGRVLRYGQIVPWFGIHTDSRYLEDFNEPGRDACFRRIAALLRRHREVLGLAGTSWYYDPGLVSVSPRLSYLRMRPVERGAFVIRSGTSAFDIQSATAKSENRRRLYAAGIYTPVSYTLLWPREQILAWAYA